MARAGAGRPAPDRALCDAPDSALPAEVMSIMNLGALLLFLPPFDRLILDGCDQARSVKAVGLG